MKRTDDIGVEIFESFLPSGGVINYPTIVLVHGALTDASVWDRVSSRLKP